MMVMREVLLYLGSGVHSDHPLPLQKKKKNYTDPLEIWNKSLLKYSGYGVYREGEKKEQRISDGGRQGVINPLIEGHRSDPVGHKVNDTP